MKNAAQQETGDASAVSEPFVSDRLLTIPNVICVIRLVGSFALVAIAWLDQRDVFLWFFIFLAMTDWIDGKLAIVLNQRSIIGARLDSWADAALYAALLIGTVMLFGATLHSEVVWIATAVASYVLTTVAGLYKYRRWPSYHTRAAKTSWLLLILGAVGLFTDWSLWPLRIALAAVTITNLEALLITAISPTWRVNVTSVYHAWRDTRAS